MKQFLVGVFLLTAFSQSSGAPLSFHDLDWSMSEKQMAGVLESKGYSCEFQGERTATPLDGKGKSVVLSPTWFCRKPNDSSVIINIGMLVFNCEAYNGCSHPYSKIAEAISRKFRVRTVEKTVGNAKSWYWDGSDGDRLELIEILDGKYPHYVTLDKGFYGKKLDF